MPPRNHACPAPKGKVKVRDQRAYHIPGDAMKIVARIVDVAKDSSALKTNDDHSLVLIPSQVVIQSVPFMVRPKERYFLLVDRKTQTERVIKFRKQLE